MQVGAELNGWLVIGDCWFFDGFRCAEIEGELGNDLPAQADVRTAAKAIDGGDGEGIEDVVLVAIDAVVPITSVEALQTKPQGYW